MSGLEKALFNLKVRPPNRITPQWGPKADDYGQFTAKQLNRQAAKAGKDETAEKNKLKKVRVSHSLTLLRSIALRALQLQPKLDLPG